MNVKKIELIEKIVIDFTAETQKLAELRIHARDLGCQTGQVSKILAEEKMRASIQFRNSSSYLKLFNDFKEGINFLKKIVKDKKLERHCLEIFLYDTMNSPEEGISRFRKMTREIEYIKKYIQLPK